MTSAAGDRSSWRSWLVLIVSGAGSLLSFTGSVLLLVTGGMSLGITRIQRLQDLILFNLGWGTGLVGVLCIPAFILSLREIRGKSTPVQKRRRYFLAASIGMLVWGIVVLIFKPVETSRFAYLLLPPLILTATILPLWWYFETGRRGLALSSPTQGWGVISFSLVVTLPVILVLELIVLLVVLVIGGMYLSTQPGFTQQLEAVQRMLASQNFDPGVLQEMFGGYLQQPAVILSGFALVSGVIPLIEEMFKPLAVWLFAGEKWTPAQGFMAGMLSGACFALWENLTALSASGDGTGSMILVARVGTGLLHIVTAGLTGWGLTSFWQSQRHLGRLVGAYLLAAAMHGLWNAAGMLTGIGPLLQIPLEPGSVAQTLETGAIAVLVSLVFINLGLLLFANARLRPKLTSVPDSIEPQSLTTISGSAGQPELPDATLPSDPETQDKE